MMKKIILAITISIITLLISCMPMTEETPEKETFGEEEFRTGNEGITMEFIKNIPPDTIYDIEPFATMIELTNEGTAAIGSPGDRVYLSGFDPAIIQGIPMTGIQIPKIEGRSLYVKEPGIDSINFKGTIRDITSMRMDKYITKIVATACYGYETIANAAVCIDPDPYSPTIKQKICTPETVFLGTQGAPIAVEEIDVMPSKGTTRFRLHINNVGNGDRYRYGLNYLQKCSPYSEGLTFDEIDYIQLGDVMVGGTNIKPTCKPLDQTGHVRLTNGAATIICELQGIRGQAPYMTSLSATLKYGYRNSMFKDLEILPSR